MYGLSTLSFGRGANQGDTRLGTDNCSAMNGSIRNQGNEVLAVCEYRA